jgi:hypothetical protein
VVESDEDEEERPPQNTSGEFGSSLLSVSRASGYYDDENQSGLF